MTLIFCQYTYAQLILLPVLSFFISSSISYARTLLLYYIFVYCPCWRVAGRELHPFDLPAAAVCWAPYIHFHCPADERVESRLLLVYGICREYKLAEFLRV
jgi:hypothetical protein